MIREATMADMPDLLRMAEAFYATTDQGAVIPYCPVSAEATARTLLGNGVLLVAEAAGRVVGMIGCMVAPSLLNHAALVASEVMWWVDPSCRDSGAGMRLMRAAEQAVREAGAKISSMVRLRTSPEGVGTIYERLGYAPSEYVHTKVL